MKFFKKQHTKEVAADIQIAVTDTSSQPAESTDKKSESSTPIATTPSTPVISKNDPTFQQMVRKEAKEMRLREQLLTPPHLARIQDALRLNETKMENLEENLERTRKQQERIRRYQELSLELHEQRAHLFEVNKQKASKAREISELARFEEFENVQGQFQRLYLLEKMRHEQKQRLTELTREVDTQAKEWENEKKRLAEQEDEMKDAQRQFSLKLDAISEALQIEGRSNYITIQERRYDEQYHTLSSQQTALEKEMQEHAKSWADLKEKTEKLRTRRQSLMPHNRMAPHGELVTEKLYQLANLESELSQVEQQQKESQRKETDENELLERVYSNYQQVEQDIQALKDELKVHRQNNHGLEGYQLQERAMKLKLRRAMLLSAQSLWKRIEEGYGRIEEVMQHINSLRLKQENLQSNIEKLDKELSVLRRTCHEKEYTFTLSKSQNVIQLRSDLKEGTSCTVCGATHHPYHSDTMLDQNKLIGEIKTEFEEMANEMKAKEQQLRSMELECAAITASKEEEENKLIMLRELQNGYTEDWVMYSTLDRTFEQCDSTVNAEARTAMLQQMVENIGSEVDEAQKELDTFNFHQKRINDLSEEIASQERTRTDLITRLNEVNTGCQVMAGQVESVENRKQKVYDTYTRLFDELDNMITIPDWSVIWKRSHEALLLRIQEITEEWNDLETKLMEAEYTRHLQEQKEEFLNQIHQRLLALLGHTSDQKQECHERIEVDNEKLERLIGKSTSKQELAKALEDYNNAYTNYEKQKDTAHASGLHLKAWQGQMDEHAKISSTTDERTAEERQGLDLWMRQYNANHPPVQYSELEEIFGNDRNWNDMRTTLRSLEMDSLLTQARVDKLGSMLVSLQAEGTVNDNDIDMIQHQLASQIETFENRRRETMMQIALLNQQLQTHHKAEESIKEEKMKE